jgi:hypothetical protein
VLAGAHLNLLGSSVMVLREHYNSETCAGQQVAADPEGDAQ